jgi:predicted lipoprotein with Yx(FWY)xxD motif
VIELLHGQKYGIVLVASAILALAFLASAQDDYSISIATDKFLGNYLVNQSGFTLYYFENDSDVFGKSTCTGDCALLWPPFYASDLTLPADLRAVEFGEVIRADGQKQTTFKSWPLYLYSKDKEPEDINGEGVEGLWHIIDPNNQPQMI